VSDAGVEALKARGNLSPEEIHKLAHKGKKAAVPLGQCAG
jgi:hypothetical protein